MIEVKKFSDVTWYIETMKNLVVNGNTAPKNIPRYYLKIEKEISQYLMSIGISLSDFSVLHSNSLFENFIVAEYRDLKKIKERISYKNTDDVPKKFLSIYNNKFSKNNINNLIVSKSNIKVCPYCNENYIVNRGKKYTSAQLDHFFDKSQNRLFAICLYNLVPVCATCNRIKSNKDFHISPYDDSIQREQFNISYIPKSADYLTNIEDIDVVFKYSNKEGYKINKAMEKLHIDQSYKFHNDYVQELLKKAYIYNKSKIDELMKLKMFGSTEEVMRIIFGNYILPEDMNKRPLSKLTKDILDELNIKL